MTDTSISLGRLGELLPEATLLITSQGRIVDANRAAERVLQRDHKSLCGTALSELVESPPDDIRRYLKLCAGSHDPIPGHIELKDDNGMRRLRCTAGVLRPVTGDSPAVLLLRLIPHNDATKRFRLLSDRIEELGRQVEKRMRTEQVLDSQRQVLEMIAREVPLTEVLETLTLFIDEHSSAGARSSILLYDPRTNCLHHAAAPGLPQEYNEAINGLEIGPNVGSCGTAAYTNRMVSVENIFTDPKWEPYRELGARAGVGACFSTPITGHDDTLLGTFAIYYSSPREADREDIRVVNLLVRTAAIAIERSQIVEHVRTLLARERDARAEAEDANRSKDEFLAMVSHELRNPLNAILGWAKVLNMDTDAGTVKKGLNAIERNASLQAELIAEILDYSRIKAGKLQLDVKPVDIGELIKAALESLRPAADAKKVRLESNLDKLRRQNIAIDPARIQQALNNLLSNALKFTPGGGSVTVEARTSKKHVHIVVRDTGRGIDPNFLPVMFERFSQADRSAQTEHEGLGLGLAITRHIVQLHHGKITADSEGHGKGATFEIRLPRRFAWSHESTPSVTPAPQLEGIRLLAVDDAPDTRSLLETLFNAAGAQVQVATDGPEALVKLHDDPPDVLLCDIGMPGMDGYEVVRRLRQDEYKTKRPRRVAAIALTAYASSRDRQRALDAGFDAHMAKPIDPAQLLRVVAETASDNANSGEWKSPEPN